MTFADNRIYSGNVFHDSFNHANFEIGLVVANRVAIYWDGRLAMSYIGYKFLVDCIANGRCTLVKDIR